MIVRHSLQMTAERLHATPGFSVSFHATKEGEDKGGEEEEEETLEERNLRRQTEHEVLIESDRVPSDNDAPRSVLQQGSNRLFTHEKVSIIWILHDGHLCVGGFDASSQ